MHARAHGVFRYRRILKKRSLRRAVFRVCVYACMCVRACRTTYTSVKTSDNEIVGTLRPGRRRRRRRRRWDEVEPNGGVCTGAGARCSVARLRCFASVLGARCLVCVRALPCVWAAVRPSQQTPVRVWLCRPPRYRSAIGARTLSAHVCAPVRRCRRTQVQKQKLFTKNDIFEFLNSDNIKVK